MLINTKKPNKIYWEDLFSIMTGIWKLSSHVYFTKLVCACLPAGEEGQDAGGLLREWYLIMSREIFNPNYALFMTTPQDRVTYTINQLSYYNNEHLSYFRFVGRIIAKAIYDNKLLECYFTRSFYKHITGQPVRWAAAEHLANVKRADNGIQFGTNFALFCTQAEYKA